MQFGAVGLSSGGFASVMDDGDAPETNNPITVELNTVDVRALTMADSLSIQDTVGQPVTARFTLVNPPNLPVVGDRIRVLYYAQVIFSGSVGHVRASFTALGTWRYELDCLDWSQTLYRRALRRTFTSLTVRGILASILSTELVGELLTVGTIDDNPTIPLVETKNARIFDVLRDVANFTGQTFYVDYDLSMQMRSSTVQASPLVLDEQNVLVEQTVIDIDRDTYRNSQTSLVTGTPAAGVEPNTAEFTEINADQVAARQIVEFGTGLYEDVEELTHPSSNVQADLDELALGHALLKLALSGIPRRTITLTVRGYGFRGGQIATVNLPTIGVIGSYVIQRITLAERSGRLLFHTLELTPSSMQQRAYESWLAIVRGAKVTVKIPSKTTASSATFTTPGADTWTVPGGVTSAQFTCYGGSGGAGGYWNATTTKSTCERLSHGGSGGNGGKAITVYPVVAGQIYDLFVGSGGANATLPNGSEGGACGTQTNNGGSAGTASSVKFNLVTGAEAEGGAGGNKASGAVTTGIPGTDGAHGSGFGNVVSVGGGPLGGRGDTDADGVAGKIIITW